MKVKLTIVLDVMSILVWIGALVSFIHSARSFLDLVNNNQVSAPQQAAIAAMIMCSVVIPYVIARGVTSIFKIVREIK